MANNVFTKAGGFDRQISNSHANVAGTWRDVISMHTKVNGEWRVIDYLRDVTDNDYFVERFSQDIGTQNFSNAGETTVNPSGTVAFVRELDYFQNYNRMAFFKKYDDKFTLLHSFDSPPVTVDGPVPYTKSVWLDDYTMVTAFAENYVTSPNSHLRIVKYSFNSNYDYPTITTIKSHESVNRYSAFAMMQDGKYAFTTYNQSSRYVYVYIYNANHTLHSQYSFSSGGSSQISFTHDGAMLCGVSSRDYDTGAEYIYIPRFYIINLATKQRYYKDYTQYVHSHDVVEVFPFKINNIYVVCMVFTEHATDLSHVVFVGFSTNYIYSLSYRSGLYTGELSSSLNGSAIAISDDGKFLAINGRDYGSNNEHNRLFALNNYTQYTNISLTEIGTISSEEYGNRAVFINNRQVMFSTKGGVFTYTLY